MKIKLISILLVTVLACSDENPNPVDSAVKKACKHCNTTKEQMTWLRDLIETTRKGSTPGNFYVIEHDTKPPVIVHQPHVMICVACFKYDCTGKPMSEEEWAAEYPEFINKMTLIYDAPLD